MLTVKRTELSLFEFQSSPASVKIVQSVLIKKFLNNLGIPREVFRCYVKMLFQWPLEIPVIETGIFGGMEGAICTIYNALFPP